MLQDIEQQEYKNLFLWYVSVEDIDDCADCCISHSYYFCCVEVMWKVVLLIPHWEILMQVGGPPSEILTLGVEILCWNWMLVPPFEIGTTGVEILYWEKMLGPPLELLPVVVGKV